MKMFSGVKFLKAEKKTRTIFRHAFLILFIIFNCHISHAQLCDKRIKPVEDEQIQYQNRGNRCEGFYHSRVSGTHIDVVGVIKGSFQYALEKDVVIKVSSTIKKKSIQVRAVGIPIKTYYRMDTKIEPNKILYWPIEPVIYRERLSPENIGIFGWVDHPEKTYVPVIATTNNGSISSDERINVYFRTSVDVENVQWRSAEVSNGICSLAQKKWSKLPQSSYYMGRPIILSLPECLSEVLCIEVAAREQNTGRWLKKIIRVIVGAQNENG